MNTPTRTLTPAACQAGPEGILTPDLSRRLGVAPKVLLKAVPDMCKRFGVRVSDTERLQHGAGAGLGHMAPGAAGWSVGGARLHTLNPPNCAMLARQ